MKLKLINQKEELPNIISFYFESSEPVEWRAGQFLHYYIENPSPDERSSKRFFTIASAPFEKNILLTTRFDPTHSSTFKSDLKNLKIGDIIEAQGPLGSFVVEDPQKENVFIAGGVGVTPFRSILMDMDFKNEPMKVTLIYANRDEANVVYKELFEQLEQKHPSLKIKYVYDPQRIDENIIKGVVPDINNPVFFVSGPAPVVKGIEEVLSKMGVTEENIKHDYFPGYSEI